MNQHDHQNRQVETIRFTPPVDNELKTKFKFKAEVCLVYALLLLSVLSVWYILTARSVSIVAFPEVSSINVESWPSIKIGNRWLLRSGKREVTVRSDGYYPYSGEILVSSDHLQTHQINLVPLPGKLAVSLEPIAEADLYIDGNLIGKVPNLIETVEAGRRRIEVKAPRYQPFKINMSITGQRKTQSLDVRLEPAWATIQIDSAPSGANVFVGKEKIGNTPIQAEILQGNKTITLRNKGYKDWVKRLKINPNQPINMGTIALSKNDGVLKLTSIPTKVTVLLDGDFKGETPLTLKVPPDKAHSVKFQKKGYRLLEKYFTIKSDNTDQFTAELTPELAKVNISTTPTEAELLINDEPMGFANQSLDLPTFEHKITIRKKGYATYETNITPRKNFEKRMRIRLKTLEEASQENSLSRQNNRGRVTNVTFTGQKLKLFGNIRTTLGTTKQESKGVSNQPLRRVFLNRPFYISETEVRNIDYRQFIASHSSGKFGSLSLDEDKQPVSNVSWLNAALFCNWLSRRDGLRPFYVIKYGNLLGFRPDSTGYRMPTEAEWEWASKTKGGEKNTFIWGNEYPPPSQTGNFADESLKGDGEKIIDYNDGFTVSSPVASFVSNDQGLFDMDGNVAEWVHDFYSATPETRPEQDPLGPIGGNSHVIKGSSWKSSSRASLRSAYRTFKEKRASDLGFRIARYAR